MGSSNKKKTRIKSNSEYWIKKIEGNMERDKKNDKLLENEGWNVIRFWMKEVKGNTEGCLQIVVEALS